jgi:phage protein D
MTADRRQNRADFRLSIDGTPLDGTPLDAAPAATEAQSVVDITARVRPRLISLSLTEKRGGEADALDLVLDDADGKLALPRKGQLIKLQLGWAQGSGVTIGLVDKGSFTVDEVEWQQGPGQVHLTARSADLTAAFRVRREKSHRDTTLGAIARQVAAAHNLTPRIAPSLAAIPVPIIEQHQVSDMALLRRLGREHDAVATVKDRALILSPIGAGTTTSGTALPGLVIRSIDGADARYREVDRTADAGVEARWHDSNSATLKTVAVGTGGKGKPHRLRRVYHSEADARTAAQAAHRKAQRAAAEFTCTLALGRPDLYPERRVALSGFKAVIDARRWLIAELTHNLDGRGGLGTSLKLETVA